MLVDLGPRRTHVEITVDDGRIFGARPVGASFSAGIPALIGTWCGRVSPIPSVVRIHSVVAPLMSINTPNKRLLSVDLAMDIWARIWAEHSEQSETIPFRTSK